VRQGRAARQAAWALSAGANAPVWDLGKVTLIEKEPILHILEDYRILRDATVNW
jgi:hypothetical protein